MGYPPPPRRISDKKRYYYSNNPNRRPSYTKKPYTKPFGTPFPQQGVSNIPSPSAGPVHPSSSRPVSNLGPDGSARHSRYDPTSGSKLPVKDLHKYSSTPTNTTTRYSGSRYNPDSETLAASAGGPPSNFTESSSIISPEPTKSRYSRNGPSRYNPQQHSIPKTLYYPESATGSPVSPFQHLASSNRPRSMESMSNETNYSYVAQNISANVRSNKHNSITNSNPNSTSGFFNRSNKWRNHSVADLNTPIAEMNSGRRSVSKHDGDRFINSPPSAITNRPSFSKDNINEVEEVSNASTPVEDLDNSSTDTELKSLQTSNPHSLGSSLINSVPQTTRETEKQALTGNKKALGPSYTPESKDVDSTISHADYLDYKKDLNENLQQTDLKTMWSSGIDLSSLNVPSRSEKDNKEINLEKEQIKNLKVKELEKLQNHEDKELESLLDKRSTRTFLDHEYVCISDPKLLRTNFSEIKNDPIVPYSTPKDEVKSCIFPMREPEMKLWELKSKERAEIVMHQKYLFRKPVKSFKVYPFFSNNVLIHKQATRPLLIRSIQKMKRYEYLNKLKLKKFFFKFEEEWEHDCKTFEDVSKKLREAEIEYNKTLEAEDREREEREKGIDQRKSVGSSRRRNRADFVDDAEIENVLLQIDPDYKHIQAAASIPSMILDPIEKFSMKFQNVNNLVTDKNNWAKRVLKDGIDTFTEQEHELFLDAYLNNPKKFGKISHLMGGLRTAEECVLHYYRTKKEVDYKALLKAKNEKRKSNARRKRKKINEVENESPIIESPVVEKPLISHGDTSRVENHIESATLVKEETMEVSKNTLNGERMVNENHYGPVTESNEKDNNEVESLATGKTEDDVIESDSAVVVAIDNNQTSQNIGLEPPVIPLKYDAINESEKDVHESLHIDDKVTDDHNKTDHILSQDEAEMSEGNDTAQRKKMKLNDHKSSYWSVKEANAFPDLLKQFGSRWTLISEKLGTKSTTMVRNYYQRNAAQFGWKALVEEADFRRNSKSLGSLQEAQMLIQPDQRSLSNNIPEQQKPALGFFSSQPSNNSFFQNVSGQSTPTHPFSVDPGRSSFSKVSTPVSDLPPPRLPSIQLHGSANISSMRSENVELLTPTLGSKEDTLSSYETKVRPTLPNSGDPSQSSQFIGNRNFTIRSFLNNDDSNATKSKLSSNIIKGRTSPKNIVVQELPASLPLSEAKSSSISSLLNPVTNSSLSPASKNNVTPSMAIFHPPYTIASQATNDTPHAVETNNTLVNKLNFANDPLAALAAIASASENTKSAATQKARE
ncbi:hypothetical protein KAFR_0G00250 [Kazachstania africana CBS 2517]|uniref:Uncharacterized protein n=1 Tax=Kazachstania africana (strain ATCC 22294 / BCRC 22015 / CBS 2517 / CECT 1963 / NBRC 1671 / NRRL Y-8276) TaxID=1071382 RepID=H2AXF8_KAZAF|nr:hypothetical protein KAFR_0G00250 [Kazachstania africana CBS 2517]CCF59058.1 hypothetical protein KAFR_0G00250 [Kazachstania africana CBS 2517]